MAGDSPFAPSRNDLEQRSSDWGAFELGVQHITSTPEEDNRDEFLLVGVNTNNEECVRIYEEWLATHSNLQVVYSGRMDKLPAVEVRELVVDEA